jgi:hypothetical protein
MNARTTFSRPTPISLPNSLRGRRVFAQAPEALDLAALGRQFAAHHDQVKVQAATIEEQGRTMRSQRTTWRLR